MNFIGVPKIKSVLDVKTPHPPKFVAWEMQDLRIKRRKYVKHFALRQLAHFNSYRKTLEADFVMQTGPSVPGNHQPAFPGCSFVAHAGDYTPVAPPNTSVEALEASSNFFRTWCESWAPGDMSTYWTRMDTGTQQQVDEQWNLQIHWWSRYFLGAKRVFMRSTGQLTDGLVPSREQFDYCLKLVEDMLVLVDYFTRATTRTERLKAVAVFAKLRTRKSLIASFSSNLIELFKEIFGTESEMEAQSGDFLATSRALLDKYDEIKSSPMYKKLYKFLMYAMTLSLFDDFGLTLDRCRFSALEQEAMKKKYHMGPDFVRTCLDTLLFVCERGQQCLKTGSMDPLFHSGKSYDEWYTKAGHLNRLSAFYNNLEPHGYTAFQYLAELRDCIETGEAIVRHAKQMKEFDARFLSKLLDDLKLTLTEIMTKKAAMQDRKAPFSILISGGTSINKSGLTKALFYHYGKLFNLPTTAEYKYTRNSIDSYWVNFNTSQWCVQLDDIAFMNPAIATQGDPSLMEMLQVINNVPFVPIQAALEDKGRTPLLSRFVIATTNTEHMNVQAYFSCPAAITRRMPWVVNVEPLPEFKRADGTFNTEKAETYTARMAEGEYPNFWNFVVKRVRVIPAKQGERDRAELVIACKFDNIYDFMSWFSKTALAYEGTQDSAMTCDMKMSKVHLCEECHLPILHCRCPPPETDSEDEHKIDLVAQTGPGSWDISYRVNVIQKTWESMKHKIVHKGEVWKEQQFSPLSLEQIRWYNFWMFLFALYFYIPFVARIIDFLFGKAWMYERLSPYVWRTQQFKVYFYCLGKRMQAKLSLSTVLGKLAACIAAGAVGYKLYASIKSFMAEIPEVAPIVPPKVDPRLQMTVEEFEDMQDSVSVDSEDSYIEEKDGVTIHHRYNPIIGAYKNSKDHVDVFNAQGANISTLNTNIGSTPTPVGDEKPNVWVKEHYETTTFDLSPTITSFFGVPEAKFDEIILRNCVAFTSIRSQGNNIGKETYPVKGLCLGGKVYLTNNHGLVEDEFFDLVVRSQLVDEGISANMVIRVTQSLITRYPEQDLATITLRGMPAKRDITSFFGKSTLRGNHRGYYLGRQTNGSVEKLPVENINLAMVPVNNLSQGAVVSLTVWLGVCKRITVEGDCGLALISRSASGPIILGIHGSGSPTNCGATFVTQEFAKAALITAQPYMIEPGTPMLSAQSATQILDDLHIRSPFRYIQQGHAMVYGSFTGHRANMKSRVAKSVLCDAMEKRDFKLEFTAPNCRGWAPKHIQLAPMLTPTTKFDPTILDRVTQNFIEDLEAGLTQEDYDSLIVYDDFTAINGAAGVAYVDKINRNTSAGFPWKKTKKHFLTPAEARNGLMDPVDVDDEIMERVIKMIENYENGKRNMVIFNASFKDEAITHKKREAKKVRVFAGAPLDATIVGRKYFMAFVRLMMTKRELFEAAPGTNATSPEWGEWRRYLTQHGLDRMVEGDFANYDKNMFAFIILKAFDVIRAILAKGKFTPKDMKVVNGIAEDTAFPLYDFFGDLVMFFGTNPSGHMLTVIINSLANSIYMRYSYAVLNPEKTAVDFKKNVSLVTYGDDNIMGVSPRCPWFNHTTISQTLGSVGVTYTMADKTAESIPYVHIDTCTFLKRMWRWDPDVKAYLAPLEEKSIIKSLMIGVASKSITPQAQAIATISSAQREYFFYGKDVFEEKTKLLRELIVECDLQAYEQDKTLLSWDQIYKDFWNIKDPVVVDPEVSD
jgi:hypothetical protein